MYSILYRIVHITFRLWVETVIVLLCPNQRTHPPYTHQNVIKGQLIIFDTHVFRYVGKTKSHKLKSLLFHS